MLKTIEITAKCADLFYMIGKDEKGNEIPKMEHDGYIPDVIPNKHDCITFNIDVETGTILNWQPFTEQDFIEWKREWKSEFEDSDMEDEIEKIEYFSGDPDDPDSW